MSIVNNPISNRIKKRIGKGNSFYKALKKIYTGLIRFFHPYGKFRNYIVFPVCGALRVMHVRPFYNKSSAFIQSQKNRFSGRRCFVIATGHSLRISDLEMLKDEITIGVNSIFMAYDKTDFRPNYYLALDPELDKLYNDEEIRNFSSFAKDGVFMNSQMRYWYKGEKNDNW